MQKLIQKAKKWFNCVWNASNLLIILSDLLKKMRYIAAAIRMNTVRNPKLIRYLIYWSRVFNNLVLLLLVLIVLADGIAFMIIFFLNI
jgi:hypothetical protein